MNALTDDAFIPGWRTDPINEATAYGNFSCRQAARPNLSSDGTAQLPELDTLNLHQYFLEGFFVEFLWELKAFFRRPMGGKAP